MRPFEADCYVEGFDAGLVGRLRSDNPYKGHEHAWDKYREQAWDNGWRTADSGGRFNDPRPQPTARQLKRSINQLLKAEHRSH